MILFPNAKINVGLFITSKRPDNYHNIETIFLPVKELCDVLEVIDNHEPQDKFTTSGIPISGDLKNNLVLIALKKMREKAPIPPLLIHLHKIIPSGAGLGGGSSDAAFMLRLLNEQYEVGLPLSTLEIMANEIGADCTVFIENKTVLAKGIGNEFSEISLPLKDHWLQIVIPTIHVATANAYKNIRPTLLKESLQHKIKSPIELWKDIIINDFETTVFKKHPELDRIKNAFYENGALFSSLTGSGSSIYGIFKDEPKIIWNSNHTVHTEKIY